MNLRRIIPVNAAQLHKELFLYSDPGNYSGYLNVFNQISNVKNSLQEAFIWENIGNIYLPEARLLSPFLFQNSDITCYRGLSNAEPGTTTH
ncbi:hypothetical protein [Erwinia mallotivora]|uniref:hypothetical protein n=1 Tax=Erwinia mallotivora TaxID=69222 RepID=UPI0021C1CA34|nr:hypothetical protein [Erwinia mallotivora]